MPVTCQICQRQFEKQITNSHLKSHQMTTQQYKELYGSDSLSSLEYRLEKASSMAGTNNPNYGNNWTQEQKDQQGEKLKGKIPWNKGIPATEEQKKKQSDTMKEIVQHWLETDSHPTKGRILTDAERYNLSQKNTQNYLDRVLPSLLEELEELELDFLKIPENRKEVEAVRQLIKELSKPLGPMKETDPVKYNKLMKNIWAIAERRREKNRNKNLSKIQEANLTLLSNINEEYLDFKCNKCGTEFMRTKYYFLDDQNNHNETCPKCYPKTIQHSEAELEIYDFVRELLEPNIKVILGDREMLKPQEIDVYVPDKKLGIEYTGFRYHTEKMKPNKMYHINKFNKCLELGIQLITVFEDEMIFHKEIVLSRIRNILGLNTQKIYARKTELKILNYQTASDFFKQNHIQGPGKFSSAYGLYIDDELVSAMAFSKPNLARGYKNVPDNVWELYRFCSILNTTVLGAASKLFQAFIKEKNPQTVISYADMRWNLGGLYKSLGFKFDGSTMPNYWYVEHQKRIHRFALRKKANEDQNKTEEELRREQGFLRIWDCGSSRWIWSNKPAINQDVFLLDEIEETLNFPKIELDSETEKELEEFLKDLEYPIDITK